MGVKIRHIRLQVEQWRAIRHVHACDGEQVIPAGCQAHDGQAEWVEPAEVARGKQTTLGIVQERLDVQGVSLALVKHIQENDVGEAVEVHQPISLR